MKQDPRLEAAQAGELHYVPVKPCRKGHRLRYTRTGMCVECGREHAANANKRYSNILDEALGTQRPLLNT
jgi:hypothetical protein